MPEETRHLIVEFLYPRYKKIFTDANPHFSFHLAERKPFTTANLEKVQLSDEPALLQFNINYNNQGYEIQAYARLNHIEVPIAENESKSPLLFMHNNTYFLWQNAKDVLLAEKFLPLGKIKIEEADWAQQLQQMVLPLAKEYNVQFNNVKREDIKDIKPEVKLLIK